VLVCDAAQAWHGNTVRAKRVFVSAQAVDAVCRLLNDNQVRQPGFVDTVGKFVYLHGARANLPLCIR